MYIYLFIFVYLGLTFLQSVKSSLYTSEIVSEVMVWEILLLSLKLDAIGVLRRRTLIQTKNHTVNELIKIESQLRVYIEGGSHKYPSAFLLMYRRVFLCNGRPLTNTVRIINV